MQKYICAQHSLISTEHTGFTTKKSNPCNIYHFTILNSNALGCNTLGAMLGYNALGARVQCNTVGYTSYSDWGSSELKKKHSIL